LSPHAQSREARIIRCVLVHDFLLLRQGVRRLFDDELDIRIVAEAENAAEALRVILEYRPDVVILNPHTFGSSAEHAERLVRQESPTSKVVALPVNDTERIPLEWGRTSRGAGGISFEELAEMVREAAEPESSRDHKGTGAVEELVPRNRVLTAREREVLKLLAEGRTVRSVAGMLGLSVKTVDAHKFNLMRKLGIHNKAELVMWAIQRKVVRVPVNF
jgi:two-component system, NarL family, response regulator NreC